MPEEEPSAIAVAESVVQRTPEEYEAARSNLQPISNGFDVGPRQVGHTLRWHGPFRVDVNRYYERGDEFSFGEEVKGETGTERVITEQLVAIAEHSSRWGIEPKVAPSFDLTLAVACGLTERSPLPILPFRLLDRKR